MLSHLHFFALFNGRKMALQSRKSGFPGRDFRRELLLKYQDKDRGQPLAGGCPLLLLINPRPVGPRLQRSRGAAGWVAWLRCLIGIRSGASPAQLTVCSQPRDRAPGVGGHTGRRPGRAGAGAGRAVRQAAQLPGAAGRAAEAAACPGPRPERRAAFPEGHPAPLCAKFEFGAAPLLR